MKVILIKDIEGLGKKGEVVEAKDGYVRNYLIPYGFALKATKDNFKRLEIIKNKEKKLLERQKKKAEALKETIEKISVTVAVEVKDGDDIYGSIGEPQLLKALKNEGIPIEKIKLFLPQPIRKLGVYNIEVKLHPQVTSFLRVWVVKK